MHKREEKIKADIHQALETMVGKKLSGQALIHEIVNMIPEEYQKDARTFLENNEYIEAHWCRAIVIDYNVIHVIQEDLDFLYLE